MPPISPDLIQAIATNLAKVPVNAADLPAVAAAVGSQVEGLTRLQDVAVHTVEPATIVVPPLEVRNACQ